MAHRPVSGEEQEQASSVGSRCARRAWAWKAGAPRKRELGRPRQQWQRSIDAMTAFRRIVRKAHARVNGATEIRDGTYEKNRLGIVKFQNQRTKRYLCKRLFGAGFVFGSAT